MNLTQEILKELVDYDPKTGVMTWRERTLKRCKNGRYVKIFNNTYAWRQVGGVFTDTKGRQYRKTCIFYKQYLTHRLALLYMTGLLPEFDTDHIDGNGLNNQFSNLRAVTRTENNRNLRISRRNTSGVKGVSLHKATGRWRACIGDNGKQIHLGLFDKKRCAVEARIDAEQSLGYL